MGEDSSAQPQQSQMDRQTSAVEDGTHMEDAATASSPAVQKMTNYQCEGSRSSAGDAPESRSRVGDVQVSGSPTDVNQDPQFHAKDEDGTDFSPQDVEAEQFKSQQYRQSSTEEEEEDDALLSPEDVGTCPFVARDDTASDIPVGEVGNQLSSGTDQVPDFPVERQSSEFTPEDKGDSLLSGDENQVCQFPSERHQVAHCEAGNGWDTLVPGNSDQSIRVRAFSNPSLQNQDEQGSNFPAGEATNSHCAQYRSGHFTVQGGISNSQFPSADVGGSQPARECEGDSSILPVDREGSLVLDESAALASETEDDGTCNLSSEQDQGYLDHSEMEDGAHPTPEGSRKRKLAVFAAAGAVIAIQTMLVAMPEIWQPLEDDDSAEKAAYQEGLHSWFGALNRAAWLLSTANGAGDGGWWVKPRMSVWFNTYLMSSDDDDRWLASLRMKRRTFLWLCNSLEVHVRKQDTRLRPSIPVTVRVGATIYRLVNGVDYYEVADKFGVGESSVHEIMQDCVPAIVRVFGHHLRWPTGEAMAEISRAFLENCGLPNCQGALGSTHVEILNPSGPEARKYINRTGHFSIVLQAVADSSLSFLDVYCGYPERTYENKVLRKSGLYRRAVAGEILAGPMQPINGGFHLRPYILGGSNYPLLPWLLVPYPQSSSLSYSQEQFIHRHEQGKVFTQQAFDILKRVFRVLGVGIRGRLELAPTIVHACCILHNILIRRKELDVEAELENIGATSHSEDVEEGFSEPGDVSSIEIRNQLSEYLVWDS